MNGFALVCSIHNPVRSLRSSSQKSLNVPRAKLKTRGDWVFAIAAPRLWNSLPVHVRLARTRHEFKSKSIFSRWLLIVISWTLFTYLYAVISQAVLC